MNALALFDPDELALAAACLREGRELDDRLRLALADLVADAARSPGEWPAATRRAFAKRDELLREAYRQHWPDARPATAAQEISTRLTRYTASAWLRERHLDTCPPRHEGRAEALFWRALRLVERTPSPERIRKILVISGPILLTTDVPQIRE